MIASVEPERVRVLNDATVRTGDYVLYWMQSSHRTEQNPALRYAVERADQAHLPLVVYFGLSQTYPEANLRHFRFMLEGLAEVAHSLESLGIMFVLRIEPPDKGVLHLAKNAAVVIVDRGYLRLQQLWYRAVAEHCPCPFVQVEGNVVVPVEVASQKEEYSAATFRRKVTYHVDRFLHPEKTASPKHSSPGLDLPTLAGESIDSLLSHLTIDRSVPASDMYNGGTAEANRRYEQFLNKRLGGYADNRNDPGGDGGSDMSPYLHFGQVSPVTLAVLAQEQGGNGTPAFLEQLIVRRELAVNFVRYNDHYDSFSSLPAWTQKTLALHQADLREYGYSCDELEHAATHDPYWNAAQQEMMKTGKMQGYMRMYWGKKVLEWSRTPEEAYSTALHLNNKYEIDGRDPNGYAGVAWCFGKHDRPWGERPVFGMVRYMNAKGLTRKFEMDRYVAGVNRIY
ncbi:MAG: deoxyribodipyrimidine photo-lyase [Methanomicrobiales archaeon]|nr:deoxyribodipyrimidine photo-lyase [Methanomicrobiales archaeon]